MSSFSVFTLACASVSWFIHLLRCSPISCIFLVNNVDGCQASVSWFLKLFVQGRRYGAIVKWHGIVSGGFTHNVVMWDRGVLPSELWVRSDFVAYGVIPSARAAVGNSGNAGTVILTRTFLIVCSGVPGPLVSCCGLASRLNLRVLAPAL